VRDRTTLLIYAQLAVWGFFLYGFGPVVPLLRDEQQVSAAFAGLHGTGLAVGIVLGGLLFTGLARRFGRGVTIWIGIAGVVVVVGLLWLVRPLPLTVACAVVASAFGSLIVNGVNAALSDYHGDASAAAISEANAAAAFTGLLAPLIVGGFVGLGLGWRPALTVDVLIIAGVVAYALAGGIRVPRGPVATRPPDSVEWSADRPLRSDRSDYDAELTRSAAGEVRVARVSAAPSAGRADVSAGRGARQGDDAECGSSVRPSREAALPRPYWIAWVLMAMTASIEVCLSLWAVDVLRTHAGLSAGTAAAGVSATLVGMFVGRLAAGRIALRVPPVRLLLFAFIVSFAGFAVFWVSTVGWLAVAGLVVAGLGNSVHYPLAISMALTAAGGQPDKAAGFSSYSIALGFGAAPFALGWISDHVGSHRAFLILPAFILAAALLTVVLSRALRASVAPATRAAPVSVASAD
jgi:MFS family permease